MARSHLLIVDRVDFMRTRPEYPDLLFERISACHQRLAMAFYNTLPLYGVMMGALFLEESLGLVHLIFGGLILAGGLWGTLGRRG